MKATKKKSTKRQPPTQPIGPDQLGVLVPTVGDRVKAITRALTLVCLALGSDNSNAELGPDEVEAIRHALEDAKEEAYWLTAVDDAVYAASSPTDDQREELERIGGGR